MPARRWTALALLLALAVTAPAQQLPPLRETLEVSIVNVDVFVTDKSGRRVHGLTRDDFEIFENGARQAITNFAEYVSEAELETGAVKAAEAAPETRRTIAVFIEQIRCRTTSRKSSSRASARSSPTPSAKATR